MKKVIVVLCSLMALGLAGCSMHPSDHRGDYHSHWDKKEHAKHRHHMEGHPHKHHNHHTDQIHYLQQHN